MENLERLVERKRLSRHKPTRREVENHLASARAFREAANLRGTLEPVRFHNLYDAAHAVALTDLGHPRCALPIAARAICQAARSRRIACSSASGTGT